MYRKRLAASLFALLGLVCTAATAADEDEWFEDDLEARIADVNAGDLVFLDAPPADPVHHHHNRITLDAGSLENGWVKVEQCHRQLDAVARTQVLFKETRARNLAILSYENIQAARVEGHTVQLTDVGPNASICIRVEMRIFYANTDGSYSLRSGPFMRRFLDGYYPMHVSLDIAVPRETLRFLDIRPQRQSGFSVRETEQGVYVDTWFEGKLYTEVRFAADACGVPGASPC